MRHGSWIAGCVAGLVLGALGTATASRHGGGPTEPPLLFRLEASGTSTPILADQPTELPTPTPKTMVVLRVDDYREFSWGGCTFRYPRHFAFEYTEHEPGFAQCGLDGNNAICTVIRREGDDLDSTALRDALVDAAVEEFAPNPATRSADRIEVAGARVAGVRLDVRVGSALIRQSYFALTPPSGALILLLQDTPNDDGTMSSEMTDLRKRLTATFRLAPK